MGKRGRPVSSPIRQNIVEILHFLQKGYGYEIYDIYRNLFPKVTMRSIYYHLRKGVDTGEFVIHNVERERGDYSWGEYAEKIYYMLGSGAKPRSEPRIKEFLAGYRKGR